MNAPRRDLEGCRRAHETLRIAIAGLTDDQVRSPSLLARWTVGHVLSHLARNADAMHRRIDAAERDEIVEQYVGGEQGRAAEIEAGASRTARDIVADVTTSAERLESTFASVPAPVWNRAVRTVAGGQHPVSELPFRRWREVEVHLVDLGLGYVPANWPSEFVTRMLPHATAGLATRCDERALTAWVLGRGAAPELPPWG